MKGLYKKKKKKKNDFYIINIFKYIIKMNKLNKYNNIKKFFFK